MKSFWEFGFEACTSARFIRPFEMFSSVFSSEKVEFEPCYSRMRKLESQTVVDAVGCQEEMQRVQGCQGYPCLERVFN